MALIVFGSLAVHGLLMMTALVATRSPRAARSQEIAVDLVRAPPTPESPAPRPLALQTPPPKRAPPKTPPLPAPQQTAQAKLEPAKLEPAKPETAKQQPSRAAPVEARHEPQQPAPLPPPSSPAKLPPSRPTPKAPAADGSQDMAALKRELAELRAQQAALRAESTDRRTPEPVAGPLAGSMQAIALPGLGDGEGEMVGYQDLVFSQLAKAKGIGEYRGQAGTTGVRFEVDAAGRLVSVEVAVSSGNEALDSEALAIVRRAAPFPPPPKDADHRFYANVNFMPAKG